MSSLSQETGPEQNSKSAEWPWDCSTIWVYDKIAKATTTSTYINICVRGDYNIVCFFPFTTLCRRWTFRMLRVLAPHSRGGIHYCAELPKVHGWELDKERRTSSARPTNCRQQEVLFEPARIGMGSPQGQGHRADSRYVKIVKFSWPTECRQTPEMVTYFCMLTSRWLHLVYETRDQYSTGWSANPNRGRGLLPHKFRKSYEYLHHQQREDSRAPQTGRIFFPSTMWTTLCLEWSTFWFGARDPISFKHVSFWSPFLEDIKFRFPNKRSMWVLVDASSVHLLNQANICFLVEVDGP